MDLIVYERIYGRLPPRPPVKPYEYLMLGPFDKWQLYGQFPWRLVVQVMLAIMVTWQTLLQTGYDNHYHKNSFAAWRELLFPDQFRAEYRGGTYTSYLYSADDMNVFLTSIMHRYDTLEERSIDIVSTYGQSGRERFKPPHPLKPPMLHLDLMDVTDSHTLYGLPFSQTVNRSTFVLDMENPLGPFSANGTERRDLLDRLMQAELVLHIYTADVTRHIPLLFMWQIIAHFDFRTRGGRVQVSMHAHSMMERFSNPETSLTEFIMLETTWPDVVVIVLGTIFGLQSLKAIISEAKAAYRKASAEDDDDDEGEGEADSAGIYTKLAHDLRFEHLVNLSCAFFNVAFSVYDLSTTDYGGDLIGGRLILGMSIFLTYVCLTFYLQWFPKYFVLEQALRRGIVPVGRLLVGVTPVYIAFCFLSMVWLGTYCHQFSTFRDASITLFCVLNGDAMLAIFNDAYTDNPLRGILALVLLYSFCMLFMYVVLSIFVVILEEAYYSVAREQLEAEGQPRYQFPPDKPLEGELMRRESVSQYIKRSPVPQHVVVRQVTPSSGMGRQVTPARTPTTGSESTSLLGGTPQYGTTK